MVKTAGTPLYQDHGRLWNNKPKNLCINQLDLWRDEMERGVARSELAR